MNWQDNPLNINNKNTTMFVEPLRNEYMKTYHEVITFSDMPDGPIRHLVKPIRPPKLSAFHSQPPGCKYALVRSTRSSPKNPQSYLTAGDLPAVMEYLLENGYIVDTHTPADLSMAGIYLGGVKDKGYSGEKRCVAVISYSEWK